MPNFDSLNRNEVREISTQQMTPVEVAAIFDRNRLRIARELRGLKQVDLAKKLATVSSASLSQFEAGHARPSAVTLEKLSDALHVPIAFFASPMRPTTGPPPDGFFRSLRSTTASDRNRTLAMAELVHEFTLAVENVVALPELDLPDLGEMDGEVPERHIEQAASDLRAAWNIKSGPIENVVREIERRGVVTARFPVSAEKIDAFSVNYPDRPVVVLSSDKGARARSRFDGSHEIAHLLFHGPAQIGSKLAETQASQFAAAFLMPKEEIEDLLPAKADWPRLVELKNQWQVSIGALLYRAKTLGRMTPQNYTQAMKYMSMKGWRKREPGDDVEAEMPQLLRAAIGVAETHNHSLESVVADAGLPFTDLKLLLGVAPDNRPVVTI